MAPSPHRLYTFYMFYMVKSFVTVSRDYLTQRRRVAEGFVLAGGSFLQTSSISQHCWGLSPSGLKRLKPLKPLKPLKRTLSGSVPKWSGPQPPIGSTRSTCSTWLNLLEKWGGTPMALAIFGRKRIVLPSYRLGDRPEVRLLVENWSDLFSTVCAR